MTRRRKKEEEEQQQNHLTRTTTNEITDKGTPQVVLFIMYTCSPAACVCHVVAAAAIDLASAVVAVIAVAVSAVAAYVAAGDVPVVYAAVAAVAAADVVVIVVGFPPFHSASLEPPEIMSTQQIPHLQDDIVRTRISNIFFVVFCFLK